MERKKGWKGFDDMEHYDDLEDQEDRTHIRGANNAYLGMLRKLRTEPSVGDRDGLTRNHVAKVRCPKCGSEEVCKAGMMRKKGQEPVQMYRCGSCGRRFTASSVGGIAASKLPTTMIVQFIKSMTMDSTYATERNFLGISEKTAIYWRFLLLKVAEEQMSGVTLSDTVYIDEMYFGRNGDCMVPLDLDEQREKLRKRGLSKDLVCVYVGIDSKGRCLAHVADKGGKPDSAGILGYWSPRISEGSVLVHDCEKSHTALVKANSLESRAYNESKDPETAHEEMRPVNHLCAYLRGKCNKHRGIRTKNLQAYLTAFLYLKMMRARYHSKAYRVVAHEMVGMQKKVRFRDVFPRKSRKSQ